MTLKTSLIITGDSATATAAVEDLTTAVDKLDKGAGKAAPALAKLDDEQAKVSTSAKSAATGVKDLATASTGANTSGRALAVTQGAIGTSLVTVGNNATRTTGQMTGLNSISGIMGATFARVGFQGGALAVTEGALAVAQGAVAGTAGTAAVAVGALGTAIGITEAVITGGLSIAISALTAGVALLVDGLFDSEEASDDAAKAADNLADYVGDLGNFFDKTTGRIKETNQALIQFAALSAYKDRRDAEKAQSDARAAGNAALNESTRLSLGERIAKGALGYVTRGTTSRYGFNNNVGPQANTDVADVLREKKDIDARLLAIATSTSSNAKNAEALLAARAQFAKSERDKQRASTEMQAFSSGVLPVSERTPEGRSPRPKSGSGGGGREAGAIRDATSATRESTAADRAAEAAKRELEQALSGVIGRYDPAKKALVEYNEELAKIAKLEAAGATGGGISKGDAARYRELAAARRDAQLADVSRTPEAVEAERAAKSIDDLIGSLRGEIAAINELDPVKRALLSVEKELAALTPTQRAAKEIEISNAVLAREATRAEADATRDAVQAKRELQQAAVGALDAILIGGQKAGDVVKRLAQSIASAALEASLLGTGPLAALLKGGIGFGSGGTRTPVNTASSSNAALVEVVGGSVGKSTGTAMDKVFGTGGSFAATLKNAGIGYAAGSIAGSGAGGAVGGAVGGKVAEKYLTSLLGTAAGPLGSIVGGLLGGVVGKLFAPKAAPGGATVSNVGGSAGVSGSVGSDRAAIQAGTGLAGSVSATINQIVAQLGGTIGDFNVQIGKYKDDLRVNVNGKALGGVTGSGASGFGTDENAAVNFAAAQAIAQGAIAGVSDAVAKALRSSPDVDAALKEALKVQQVETLIGGIGGQIDKAFRDFEATAKERVRIAQAYGFDVVAIEKRNAADRAKVAEDLLKGQVGSLQNLIAEMTRGSLFEGSAIERIAALKPEIEKAKADLDSGVAGAGDTLAGLYEQLNAASKAANGTTGAYAADRTMILDQARAAVARANERITAAQAAPSDPALRETNAALEESNDLAARMLAEMAEQTALLAQLGASTGGYDLSELARV